jgi:HK97 family phage prohead protease
MERYNTKSFSFQLKELDVKERIVAGYFAAFGNVDSDGDIIRPGAFKKSILENGPQSATKRIKHLFNHWDTVGVLEELKEDEFGLYYRSKIGRHTLGNDVLMMYEDSIITEHSIGFNPVNEQPKGVFNEIIEVQLWEGSCLDKWGANMNTPVMKAQEKANLYIERLGKLTKALRNGSYSDETMQNLEIQLKQIQSYIIELTTQPGNTTEPEPQQKGVDMDKLIDMFNN